MVTRCNSARFILLFRYMESAEVRKKFLEFFKERGHTILPSASLVPENDSTTLFTGSGMQPLVPYLLGQPHPAGKRLANSQKSFRAEDIDEVGDNRHTTFFEMLGNWSFGDYWKQEQLPWLFEFLTKEIKLKPENLYVTVFSGGKDLAADNESIEIWKKLFATKKIPTEYIEVNTEHEASEKGMQPGQRIFGYGVEKNWWSRAGLPSKMPAGEPGGPDSEVFYDFGTPHDTKFGKKCHPNCDCGRFLEIGNSVFMEYKKKADGTFEKLKQRNVDFGGGLERITAASNNDPDIFHVDVFKKMSEALAVDPNDEEALRKDRIIFDHIRAAVFLIADGVLPSNKGRGYVVRKTLRRAALFSRAAKTDRAWLKKVIQAVISSYRGVYGDIEAAADNILKTISGEFEKFSATLDEGLKEFHKRIASGKITSKDAFDLYQSYGFPWEVTKELAQAAGILLIGMDAGFETEFQKHQDISRTASAGTFKGGLADHSERTTRLHTAHHLLLRALQIVLGPEVKQRGSNITSERLRLDFAYDGKMTDEQKKKVEKIVNDKIKENMPVIRSEMSREEAEKLNAEHEFGQKYPDRVSVYSIGPMSATVQNPEFAEAFSIEFCGGPHVARTGEIGPFKIVKEEAVSAGVRRIRGTLDQG